MSWLPSRLFVVGSVVVGIAIGCGGSESTGTNASTFCGASVAAASACAASATSCDTTLTSQCTKLDSVLNRTLLDASRDCLESGVCGASSCLTKAQASTKPLTAHTTLAKDYCATCAPGLANCTTQFYARTGNAPGSSILPFAETIAAAVDKACVTDASCAGSFAACASDAVASAVGGLIPGDVASCVTASFQQDNTGGTDTTPGGGPTVSKCTLDNCQGCCRDDKCETESNETSCGVGAVSCQTCSGAQTCTDGACREPCGPDNCPGCCSGDTCVDGTTSTACGTGGAACDTCSDRGSKFVCDNQQCIDTSCAATCLTGCCDTNGCRPGTAATGCGNGGRACVNCGSGNACDPSARTCHLDLDSTWDFYAISAQVSGTNSSGGTWDPFSGLPDPYVIMYSSGTQAQTAVVNDTTSPVWNQITLTNIKASQYIASLSFNIWDSDYGFGVDPDDLIGGCTMPVQQSNFDGKPYYWTCKATATQAAIKITGKFVKH